VAHEIWPVPSGCAQNLAIRRLRTCQGWSHWLHAAPSLARFWAAARLAFETGADPSRL